MYELHPGDRVRAKVRTMFGWKGTGTVLEVEPDVVVLKDGASDPDNLDATAMFCRHGLTKTR